MKNGFVKNKARIRIYAWLGLLFIGNILIAYLVIVRTVQEIKELNQTISYERSALESRYAHRARAKNILSDLKMARVSLPELESSLLRQGQELGFVTVLEEAAAAHNIEQKIQISPREGKEPFGDKVPINLIINGAWSDTLRYLRELEKMQIMFIIDGISFAQGIRIEDRIAGKINGTVKGHIYIIE